MGAEESRVESIFHAAMDRGSAAERAAYLDRACAGDPELRSRVERLLEVQPELSRFVQAYSESVGREISSEEVHTIFQNEFVAPQGPYELVGYWPRPDDKDPTFIHGEVKVRINGE